MYREGVFIRHSLENLLIFDVARGATFYALPRVTRKALCMLDTAE